MYIILLFFIHPVTCSYAPLTPFRCLFLPALVAFICPEAYEQVTEYLKKLRTDSLDVSTPIAG
jgi:hypothetical protein